MGTPAAESDTVLDTAAESDTVLDTAVDAAVQRIVSRFAPQRIVLFGSRARGETGRDSDIDLLVVVPETADKHRVAVAIRRELRDLPASKDIVVATPAEIERRRDISGTVLHEALQTGTVVYEQR